MPEIEKNPSTPEQERKTEKKTYVLDSDVIAAIEKFTTDQAFPSYGKAIESMVKTAQLQALRDKAPAESDVIDSMEDLSNRIMELFRSFVTIKAEKIEELNASISTLKAQSVEDVSIMKTQIEALEAERAAAIDQMQAAIEEKLNAIESEARARDEASTIKGVLNDYKMQVEDLKANQKRAAEIEKENTKLTRVVEEKDSLLREQISRIKSLNEQLDFTKDYVSKSDEARRRDIDDLRKAHDADLSRQVATHQAEIENTKKMLTDLHLSEVSRIKAEHQNAIKEIQDEYNKAIAEYKKEIAELNERLSSQE